MLVRDCRRRSSHGGTKIAITGHGFFKDFTVKDGNIIPNSRPSWAPPVGSSTRCREIAGIYVRSQSVRPVSAAPRTSFFWT